MRKQQKIEKLICLCQDKKILAPYEDEEEIKDKDYNYRE